MAPPAALTGLVGRERELRAVREQLLRPDVRLLTLVGPPGVGKTRLALEVAAALRRAAPGGVRFADLSALAESDRVLPALAHALGVDEAPDEALPLRLRRALGGRRALLVVDNFEHLLPAAPALAGLLADCPRLTCLVTSRSPLRLRGERVFPVPPLPVPDPADLQNGAAAATAARSPAVALFVERARAVRPDFALTDADVPAVAEVCRRLDGLPLAIELAAARADVLPPPALLARLERRLPLPAGGARDLPERQQTLARALDWSYRLLAPRERRLLRRLSVFPAGCTLAAARAVAARASSADGRDASPGAEEETLEAVAGLVERSLLYREEGPDGESRFRQLQTVREYAAARLEARREGPAARRARAQHLVALAEAAEPELRGGPGQRAWLAHLEAEHDNLRAVLRWAASPAAAAEGGPAGAECGARLAAALARFWVARGHLREGRGWLGEALARPGAGDGALGAKTACRGRLPRLERGGRPRGAPAARDRPARLPRAAGRAWHRRGAAPPRDGARPARRPRAGAPPARAGPRPLPPAGRPVGRRADARTPGSGRRARRRPRGRPAPTGGGAGALRGAGGRPRRGLDPALPGQAGPPGRGLPERQGSSSSGAWRPSAPSARPAARCGRCKASRPSPSRAGSRSGP